MAEHRWVFTKEEIANTPSRKCGIGSDKELNYRQQAANLMQDMGQQLQVYPFMFLSQSFFQVGVPRVETSALFLRFISHIYCGK